jgi:hypothetical protein
MLLGGAAGGLFIGLAIVALLEYRDSSLKYEADVTRVLNLPVLALVPVLLPIEEQRRRRRRKIATGIATGVVGLVSVAALVFWLSRLQP